MSQYQPLSLKVRVNHLNLLCQHVSARDLEVRTVCLLLMTAGPEPVSNLNTRRWSCRDREMKSP